MKTAPIVPAQLQRDEHGVPFSAEYGDVYHPRIGASAQARHVFIAGNDLPRRWQGRESFVVLETGFGLGNNFLATWQAWLDDPARCEKLVFVSIERHPLRRDDLRDAHSGAHPEPPPSSAGTPSISELAGKLVEAWPALTPNLHRLEFEAGRVQLFLALGDVHDWLPELRLQADAIFLDGFAPARNPRMWDRQVCKALGRLAATGATLATWSAASAVRADLTSAGFDVRLGSGIGGKRDITLATYAPRHVHAARAAQLKSTPSAQRRALIIGGGLAGCAAAWALSEKGWASCVIDRRERIASEASGNPAGLFHGIFHADDGPHARLHRAASFEARRAVAFAIDRHGASGAVNGLLRIEHALDLPQMRHALASLGMPSDYVQALSEQTASELAGVPLQSPAWYFPGGGWVDPAALAASFVARGGPAIEVRHGTQVHAIRHERELWLALDRDGQVIDSAPVLILANASDAQRLAPAWLPPLQSIRGQLSWLDTAKLADAANARALDVRLPVADAGYVLPQLNGRVVFGATSTENDEDPSVREQDHAANLAKLERLLGRATGIDASMLSGRTAWRCVTADRLPLIGQVAELDSAAWLNASRRDQVRFVPRVPGLFVFTALGSRGITWSALGAQVLAAGVAGGVAPLEASLLDALDPARFAVRSARRDQG